MQLRQSTTDLQLQITAVHTRTILLSLTVHSTLFLDLCYTPSFACKAQLVLELMVKYFKLKAYI